MITFALDTNIISYILKGNKELTVHVAQELADGNDSF